MRRCLLSLPWADRKYASWHAQYPSNTLISIATQYPSPTALTSVSPRSSHNSVLSWTTAPSTWLTRARTLRAVSREDGCGIRCVGFLLGPSNDVDHLQLLGSDSHDIDIALENMTGHAFALQFTEFASRHKRLPVKSVAVVKGNPGQSKHLETAKTTVLGLDLDFVNLRDEAYADDSRIPTDVVSYPS